MKNKFVCVHGHFYQPPRENPWTGEVEVEKSAAPDHDWNEKIFRECYRANLESPIQDSKGKTLKVLNNYEHLSFDFGPTLLAWLRRHHAEALPRIAAADVAGRARRSGHGNAMAQPYNHIILPLAGRRDKRTQIRWGIADFEALFSRRPEGMWLPETAVDEETLECLIAEGISFTLLAPRQAARVRPLGGSEKDWAKVSVDSLETMRPYRWLSREIPGRGIDLVFYHDKLSRAVAFERILNDGENFVRRMLEAFEPCDHPEILLLATDGESYGHHHRFGNMALSYAAERLGSGGQGAQMANPGQYLRLFPPQHEVEILPNTAWSCFHGIGRWKEDCGCNSGAHPDWNQKWRKPLRDALDWLAKALDDFYEERASLFFQDPWQARDAYLQGLSRRPDAAASVLAALARKALDPDEVRQAAALCEMERCRLTMFTSDGWFFDDISGIEPAQLLKYAAKAMELAASLQIPDGRDLEETFIRRLEAAPSNDPECGDGAQAYRKLAEPLKEKAAIKPLW